MELCLRWLKAWIAKWQPRRGEAPRFAHYIAGTIIAPAVMLVYVVLLIIVRFRGPYRLDGASAGGATLQCQLPDLVQFYLFLFGVWEPDISAFVQNRLSAGDTFCDIGSHVGYYSLLASAAVGPSGRVVAVEASPSIFAQLRENISRNGAANVRAVNVAATAEAGVLNVHRGPPWNLGWSTTHANRGLPVECQVPASPIADILTADESRTLRLIKIDVEGTERELFAGLVELLQIGRPDAEVILELSPCWWTGPRTTVEEALQPFLDAGFHLYVVNNHYSPWRYFWGACTQSPRRARSPLQSWIGQYDVILSRVDRETI